MHTVGNPEGLVKDRPPTKRGFAFCLTRVNAAEGVSGSEISQTVCHHGFGLTHNLGSNLASIEHRCRFG